MLTKKKKVFIKASVPWVLFGAVIGYLLYGIPGILWGAFFGAIVAYLTKNL